MRILIHCNGGPAVGMGHVVRSLALAEEAVASGHDVTLAGDFSGNFVLRQLEAAPVTVRQIARNDRAALVRAVEESRPDVLHFDTYDELVGDAAALAPESFISNMEDGAFGRRPADVVIDPNFGAELQPAMVQPGRAHLRGARYAPLRSTVIRRRGKWQLRAQASRVLIVMGGTDPLNLTPRVVDVLAASGLPLRITAITTRPAHTASDLPPGVQVDFVPPVDDLPALLTQQDLVVSAAGTSVWELCCLGVPMALVCAVENQRAGYERIVGVGAAFGLGERRSDNDFSGAVERLREVLTSPVTRDSLARQASGIVDGLGSWRIIRAWEQLAEGRLNVRLATIEDAELILRWRNDPETRGNSRHRDEISLETHREWLKALLSREDRVLLVATDHHGNIGTVRWDQIAEGEWEVSITVAPERRGQGLARPLLLAGELALLHRREDVRASIAGVHKDNGPSLRLFRASGYFPDLPADDAGFLRLRKPMSPLDPGRAERD